MASVQAAQSGREEQNCNDDRETHLKEWETARDTMQFFDDKLHDLRKYGFSFITVFLSADGILLSSDLSKGTTSEVKFGVFGVTLILILALHFLDKNYTVFQGAAATRALLLERNLNIELSETIAQRASAEHISRRVFTVYLLFTLSVLFLSWFSLGMQNIGLILALMLIAVICTIFIANFNLGFRYEGFEEDWTISPLECSSDGIVKITLTNLGQPVKRSRAKELLADQYLEGVQIPEPIPFKKDGLVWEIINEETGEVKRKTAERNLTVYESQTWIVPAREFGKSGVYQLRPRGWPLPLHRRICVSDIFQKPKRLKANK